jgi:hypothetical protein
MGFCTVTMAVYQFAVLHNVFQDWVEELKKNVPEGKLVIGIACTKADLDSQRVRRHSRITYDAQRVGHLVTSILVVLSVIEGTNTGVHRHRLHQGRPRRTRG